MNVLLAKPRRFLAWFFNWLADCLFPIYCLGCRAFGSWLCPECFAKINFSFCQQCPSCSQLNYWGEYCPDCHQCLDGVLVMGSYEQPILKQMIKTFKYRFIPKLSEPLASLAIVFLGQILSDNSRLSDSWVLPKFLENFSQNLIIPVPLSKRRRAWRGFNQAELLARQIADYYSLELSLDLKKNKHTRPQVKLDKIERQRNLEHCFAWHGSVVAGRNIILIDDLVTTGSTLQECAKILKAQGANEVWALVLAKR